MDTESKPMNSAVHGVMHGHDEILLRDINYEDGIKRIVGRKILGKRCVNDHIRDDNDEILVAVPDSHLDPNIFLEEEQWFMVLMVGDECRYISASDLEGQEVYMRWPLWGEGVHDIGDSLWIIEERLMDAPHDTIQPLIYTK